MNQTPTGAESTPSEADHSAPNPPSRPPSRFPASVRWTLVFVVVMIGLVVAIWPRGSGADAPSGSSMSGVTVSGPRATDAQVDDAQLAQARQSAALPGCPATGLTPAAQSVLAGVTEPCLADGRPYDVGAGTAGKPLVVNMWAVWCLPCRHELPVMEDYAQRAAGTVNVLAVHAREGANNPYLVLKYLSENGVRLPVVLDADAGIAAALGAPRVYPSTVLVRPDGTVAKVLPEIFDDPDQVAAAVREYLGVST
ncbi:TlpA family protein disulfide reductase [Gordonia rhizosphera]|uniref:Putative thiol-disulfide oxidoreductase n=1 Tax=Gordonia rhizosphera NBRC 16068 TaxID=1108045 RepID=K6W9Y7_9ACTN|nr:TlpA disulfide reductase family protein [Gordonia rhizosphera]GAB89027.1 putative thiol-disulfide oxidoreductase [Gordonia rhizosphera NBRC 16068]